MSRIKTQEKYLKKKPDVERIVFDEMDSQQIIEGLWTKENSKGTYRILTEEFQAFDIKFKIIIE